MYIRVYRPLQAMRPMACLTFLFLSYSFPFLVSTSLFHPLAVIIDFYFAKVSWARNTANTGVASYWRKTSHDPPKSKIAVS